MPTYTAAATPTGLDSRRLRALVAIPLVVLAASIGGIFAAAPQPEVTFSAAVCNLPTVPNCAS